MGYTTGTFEPLQLLATSHCPGSSCRKLQHLFQSLCQHKQGRFLPLQSGWSFPLFQLGIDLAQSLGPYPVLYNLLGAGWKWTQGMQFHTNINYQCLMPFTDMTQPEPGGLKLRRSSQVLYKHYSCSNYTTLHVIWNIHVSYWHIDLLQGNSISKKRHQINVNPYASSIIYTQLNNIKDLKFATTVNKTKHIQLLLLIFHWDYTCKIIQAHIFLQLALVFQ